MASTSALCAVTPTVLCHEVTTKDQVMTELYETRFVDAWAEPLPGPDGDGWQATSATTADYRVHALIDDVDGRPLGITTEEWTVRCVTRVPSDSARMRRLAWERENGVTE